MPEKEPATTTNTNLAEFTALAHLLALRNGGPIALSSCDDVEDADCEDDNDAHSLASTAHPASLSHSRDDGIRRRFLDRISELLATEKHGRCVSAAMCREDEKEGHVDVWVARNGGVAGNEDLELLGLIGRTMTAVAKGHEGAESASERLWHKMLSYAKLRVDGYRKELKQIFNANRRQIRKGSSKYPSSEPRATADLQHLMSEMYDQLCGAASIGKDEDTLSRLVQTAHKVRKWADAERELGELLEDSTLVKKIHRGLCFLGRLRAAYETFREIGLDAWRGLEVRIYPVRKPDPVKVQTKSLSLAQTFNLLGLSLNDNTVKTYIKKKGLNTKDASSKFDKLQGQRVYVHAEVQLIFHMEKENVKGCFPYVGSSKLNCFLCADFIAAYGGLSSRECHGRPYSKWLIPQTRELQQESSENMWNTMRKVEQNIKRHLLRPVCKAQNFRAESTIGLTDMSGPSGTADRMSNPKIQVYRYNRDKEREQQHLIDRLYQGTSEISEQHECESAPVVSEEEARFNVSQNDEDQKTECGGCLRMTTRRCGKCGRDWFCSSSCEREMSATHIFQCNIGRPLNTADYLKLDCFRKEIPKDRDVLEDFGFSRLLLMDQKKLLGLYIGLFEHLEVTAEEMHGWCLSGTMVENIVKKFSEIPEGLRGSYYPWFLENEGHIFGPSPSVGGTRADLSAQQMLDSVQQYLDPEDRGKSMDEIQPWSKQTALMMLALTAQPYIPPPSLPWLYNAFGFCVCRDEHEEGNLSHLYYHLIFGDRPTFWPWKEHRGPRSVLCSFTEFWRAFEEGRLVKLMDSKGLQSERQKFRHLDKVLSYPDGAPRPAVWNLQTFLNDSAATVVPDEVLVPYGFFRCRNPRDTAALRELYGAVLTRADPLELDTASRQGRLLAFVRKYADVSARQTELLSW